MVAQCSPGYSEASVGWGIGGCQILRVPGSTGRGTDSTVRLHCCVPTAVPETSLSFLYPGLQLMEAVTRTGSIPTAEVQLATH